MDTAKLIDQLTEGVDIPEQVKNMLVGVCVANLFRAKLDVLIEMKISDPRFVGDLTELMDSAINSLTNEQKALYEKTLEEESNKKIVDAIVKVCESLPEETRNSIISNLDKLSS